MRKIISTLMLLLTVAFLSFGQDIRPIGCTNLQSPSWSVNLVDGSLYIWKNSTLGFTKVLSADLVQTKVDSIAYYRVPYTGAHDNVNLGVYSILAEGQQLPLSNGGCQISSLTDNGNGSVTLGTGDYHLSANVSGKGSHNYTLTGGTFTLTDQSQNYIVADYNSGSPYIHVITDVTIINETTIVPIYSIFRNGTILHIQNWDALGIALANKIHQSIVKTQRYRRESGLAVSEYGTHNLNLAIGRIWTGAVPITLDAIATATDNLFFFRHVAGVWTPSIQTAYNFTQYDNGTNLVDLTANRYAVNWIFRGVESQKHLYIVAGTGDYTEAQATAATLPAIPVAISSHAVLVAKLIVQKNAATALSIQSAFDIQFGLSAIQSHGDLILRDAIDSHPAGAITNTPYSTISAISVQGAINELTDEKEPTLTKGNLTESVTGLQFNNTRQVIGGAADLSISSGYVIPTTTQLDSYKLKSDSILASGYATVHRLNGKEPAFTKNTAFNKNFGTTTGTVLEGRTFGTAANSSITDFAPAFGSVNYIQNQIAVPQSVEAWITGQFRTNNIVYFTSRYTGSFGGTMIANNGSGENLVFAETASGEYTFGNGGIGSAPVHKTIRFNTGTNQVWFEGLTGSGGELLSHSSTGEIIKVTNGSDGQVLKMVSGVPAFANIDGGGSQNITSTTNTNANYNTAPNIILTMTTNITNLTFSNIPDGAQGDILVIENSTGGYGITNIIQSGLTSVYPDPDGDNTGNKPVSANINSAANRKTIISYHRIGSYLNITYGNFAQ